MTTAGATPWYREPWPWILMVAPGAAVIAGTVTLFLAIGSFDGLVAEDYYKQGLAVNQRLARADRARALGVQGEIVIESAAGGPVHVRLSGDEARRSDLSLILSHPTRAGLDQRIRLTPALEGGYVGRFDGLAPGRWNVLVESDAGQWRIRGELKVPSDLRRELSWQP